MPNEDVAVSPPPPQVAAAWKMWIRMGFFFALGVALLMLLVLISQHLWFAALGIVSPFALATVFAMLLDPLVDKLEARGTRRIFAALFVFGVTLAIVIGIGYLAIPALVSQAGNLQANAPGYLADLQKTTNTFLTKHPKILGIKLPKNFDAIMSKLNGQVTTSLTGSAGHIETVLVGSVTMVLESVVTVIVTFYLLLDIDRFRARLLYLLPNNFRKPVTVFAHDIGRVFAEYLRGLLIVSVLYGLTTVGVLLGLSLLHSDIRSYALLVGFAGGILYAVPYVGPIVTALVTFLVAYAAGGIGFGVTGILATLVVNQVFDNIITPRIVGGGVGLHPVVSLFALTLGGALFGIWGLLLSVPVAASLQAILFRLFPKLTTPTPPEFLEAQGVPPDEGATANMMRGDDAPAG